jgi:putative sigma-54 modulation protein
MQMAVTFRHMETDRGVKDYVKEKVQRLQKYIVNPSEIHVVLSAEKFRHIAEITIVGNGVTLNSQGRNSDLYSAIDQMVEKAERQIRKRRGRERQRRSNLSSPSKTPNRGERSTLESKEDAEVPSITQRKHTLVKPMSLEEAVAQMDLSKEDFFVFINSDSGQMNVLHRNNDGGYEWVEPYSE